MNQFFTLFHDLFKRLLCKCTAQFEIHLYNPLSAKLRLIPKKFIYGDIKKGGKSW